MSKIKYNMKIMFIAQKLFNLVKSTQYDLTLLKYEIGIWGHLKDWLKLKKSMSFQVNCICILTF